ncbi:hypothetical protein EVA_06545 [gut metagenome]|uniref:Uncharacterized protein n=1 Tax=gut metagenome TaxID=749906 RepID=J9GRY2_9ZZZZ
MSIWNSTCKINVRWADLLESGHQWSVTSDHQCGMGHTCFDERFNQCCDAFFRNQPAHKNHQLGIGQKAQLCPPVDRIRCIGKL